MSERCATCRFWQETDHRSGEARAVGAHQCIYPTMLDEAAEWGWDDEGDKVALVLTEDGRTKKAFVMDGSSYFAALYTKPDFGCVAHEPAEETRDHVD